MEDLRARTEKFLAVKGPELGRRHWDDVQKLVQDLQVHQFDLERQTEELGQRAALYRLIVETAMGDRCRLPDNLRQPRYG